MIELKDERQRGWFWIDNDVFRKHGVTLGPYGLAVYMALAYHANRKAACWPSYDTLAAEIGISKRKLIEVTKLLVDLRLIEVRRRSTEQTADEPPQANLTNVFVLLSLEDGSAPRALGGAGGAPQGVQVVHPGGAGGAPKQESNNKNQIEQGGAPAPPADRSKPLRERIKALGVTGAQLDWFKAEVEDRAAAGGRDPRPMLAGAEAINVLDQTNRWLKRAAKFAHLDWEAWMRHEIDHWFDKHPASTAAPAAPAQNGALATLSEMNERRATITARRREQ